MAKQIKKIKALLRRGARYAPLLVMVVVAGVVVVVAVMVLWPVNQGEVDEKAQATQGEQGHFESIGQDVLESRESINGRLGLDLDQGVFPSDIQGITMPHHLLVAGFMDKFYGEVAADNSYERVVILSPNHFGIGHNFLQTTNELDEPIVTLDAEWIDSLTSSKTLYIEPADFVMEHGVYVQYPFIAKYFPEAKVLPIIVKKDTPCEILDNLAGQLEQLQAKEGGRTLFIASLDFTHYSDEALAVENDRATVRWLMEAGQSGNDLSLCASAKTLARGLDKGNVEAVAIDSGEVLYVINSLMSARGSGDFTLWDRTSSASLIKSTPKGENTSHIFGYFSS